MPQNHVLQHKGAGLALQAPDNAESQQQLWSDDILGGRGRIVPDQDT
jgi:hypothetical protein